MPNIDPSQLHVPAAHRYTAAWAEINSRLVSRQTVNLYFATVGLTAVSLILSTVLTGGERQVWTETLAVGLIVLTWAYAFWIRHNDAIIGLLSAYCKALELKDDPTNKLGVPAWHTDAQDWIVEARCFRKYSDRASILIAVLTSLPAIILSFAAYFDTRTFNAFVLGASGLLGIGAALFFHRNALLRLKIAASSFRANSEGAYAFMPPPEAPELSQRA